MVLEYNCRLGDPETQPLMMRMDFDLAAALDAAASRRLDAFKSAWKTGASVCVVMTSSGYPGPYEAGKRIDGLAAAGEMQDVVVFHAGTKKDGGSIVTAGGRVLGVTATGASLELAIRKAYSAVDKIHFDGAHYRTDIGAKGVTKSLAAGDRSVG
jgi:phosphoribosylamine--glycine ligase